MFKWTLDTIPIGRSGESNPISIRAYLDLKYKFLRLYSAKRRGNGLRD